MKVRPGRRRLKPKNPQLKLWVLGVFAQSLRWWDLGARMSKLQVTNLFGSPSSL